MILFFFGLAGGIIGGCKGSSFFVWFLVSFVRPVPRAARRGAATAARPGAAARSAPAAAPVVKLYDAVCMRCGTELEFPDVASSSSPIRGATSARAL